MGRRTGPCALDRCGSDRRNRWRKRCWMEIPASGKLTVVEFPEFS